MRDVSDEMEKIWLSGDYTGSRRPIVRATLQHPRMRLRNFTLPVTNAKDFTTKIYDDQSGWQATPPSVSASGAGIGSAVTENPKRNLKVASSQVMTKSSANLLKSGTGTPDNLLPLPGVNTGTTTGLPEMWKVRGTDAIYVFEDVQLPLGIGNSRVYLVVRQLAPGKMVLWAYCFNYIQYSDGRTSGGTSKNLEGVGLYFNIRRSDGSTEGNTELLLHPTVVPASWTDTNGQRQFKQHTLYTLEFIKTGSDGKAVDLSKLRWSFLGPRTYDAVDVGRETSLKKPLSTATPSTVPVGSEFTFQITVPAAGTTAPAITTTQTYADYFHKPATVPVELPNIKSVSWSRDVDTDVSSATISMWNTAPLPIGQTPLPEQLDQPGFFTYNRGTASFASSRWKHTRNQWYAQLMPDNIIRTYEGYGFNPKVGPDFDRNLYSSGCWIIDDVRMTADGMIEIKARDYGKILLEQLLTGPIVPDPFEPLSFKAATPAYETIEHYSGGGQIITHEGTKQVPVYGDVQKQASGPQRLNKKVLLSSVSFWENENGYKGRNPGMASDDNQGTYWISVGNASAQAPFAYEWVEWDLFGQDIDTVSLGTIKSGYTAYVSVMIDGNWQGAQVINWRAAGIGRNQSNIRYIVSAHVANETETIISFPAQRKVQRIRITLGNLQNFTANFGGYAYRGAIRETDFRLSAANSPVVTEQGVVGYKDEKYTWQTISEPVLVSTEKRLIIQPAGQNPGLYSDYTDIVILLLAWAGFWYNSSSYIRYTDGTRDYLSVPKKWENVLGFTTGGAVWGDFQMTGTTGKVDLGSAGFHMKPIMDGIQVVKNILLFNFWFDEDGAAQWRQANLSEIGNWLHGPYGGVNAGGKSYISRSEPVRTQKVYSIDERQVIKTLDATITGKNVREGILTYNPDKKAGYVTPGYNPNPTGLRRLSGWPNTGYDSAEALKMTGELIAQRQLQAYRQDEIVIPAFPALQIDDQVRLVERVTNEGWLHYIKGISSKIDMADGTYEYTLSTHWLGSEPTEQWWMDYNTGAYDKKTDAGTEKAIPDPLQDTGYWYVPSTKFVDPATRKPPQTPSRPEYLKVHGGAVKLIGGKRYFDMTVESFTQHSDRWRVQWVRAADATGTRDVSYGPLQYVPQQREIDPMDVEHPIYEDNAMFGSGYTAATAMTLEFPQEGNLSEYWWRPVFNYPNSGGPENGPTVQHVPDFKAADGSRRQQFAMKNENESAAPPITRVVRQTAKQQNAQSTGASVGRVTREARLLTTALRAGDSNTFAEFPNLPYVSRQSNQVQDSTRTTGEGS